MAPRYRLSCSDLSRPCCSPAVAANRLAYDARHPARSLRTQGVDSQCARDRQAGTATSDEAEIDHE